MNFGDEIRAKHVFGELTLGEVWKMVSRSCSHIILAMEPALLIRHEYTSFVFDDDSLSLFSDANDMEPDWDFPMYTKVRAKEDYVEFDDDRGKIKLSFARLETIRFEIF